VSDYWGADVSAFYRDRSFGGRVGFGESPALVVVDMAVAFNDPTYAIGADQTSAVEAIARLLPLVRERGLPVFYTTSSFEPGAADAGIRIRKVPSLRELELGSPAVAIDPRLEPHEGDVALTKKAPSPFFRTGLHELLVDLGVDTVIVTGCSTSGCIRAAACDGASYGYHVIVPRECVADRAREPHLANLFDIDAKYGDVVSTYEVIAYLERFPARVGSSR
jgi:nicotinamidase-related amidase